MTESKFKILVCIKQVPDTTDIKWTKNNTIQREGLDLMINPFDLGAIQMALDVKEHIPNTEIVLVSMGPNQAIESLVYGIALGADRGFLLCDKKFAASDTLATAYCLSSFVKKFFSDFNLIICGQQAIDGDTAQTPSSLAEKLNVPVVTLVKELKKVCHSSITLHRETPAKRELVEVELPAVLAIDNQITDKVPSIDDFIRAQRTVITVLAACDICCEERSLGLSGSPTQVKDVFRPLKNREGQIIDEISTKEIQEIILSEVEKAKND